MDNTGHYNLGNYDVSGNLVNPITYDKNGNITLLNRKGHTLLDSNGLVTGYGVMDDLTYTYDSGNKLTKVVDNGNDTYGFKDSSANNQDYWYDANGNLLSDANKGITGITYNYLNLPKLVTIANSENNGNIQYIYDATGVKLKKIVSTGTITDYSGNYVYEGNALKQITHSEGYIEPDGSGWQYVYRYADIWGNTRITYADDNNDGNIDASAEIRREQNYYPFGLEHKGYNNVSYGVKNNLKTYQKQEFTEDLGLNTHEWKYRVSDPATGRFWHVDPEAAIMPSWSPYTFVFNNPLSFIDPDGRIPYPITIRSFAPFNYFGGGFHGDGANRGFTTSSTATARVHQRINFDTDKTQLKTNVWSSPSSHRLLPGTITGSPTVSIDNFSISKNGDSKKFDFGTHSKGSNPFIPGSPNIDVFSNFSITESDGMLNISGDLKGDNFPSTEAFITDPNGNNVFIGVGFYEGSPFSSLDGENKRDITSFSFGIQTDKKGNFTGVQYNGTDYSIGDWNKLFEQTDPHKNEQE